MTERPMSSERGTCPGAETLAAYVDGLLDVRARGEVDTHLAECEECEELVADVVRTQEMGPQDATETAASPVVPGEPATAARDDDLRPTFGRKRIWTLAGSVVAVAAALVLVVRAKPEWWQQRVGQPDVEPRLAKLWRRLLRRVTSTSD